MGVGLLLGVQAPRRQRQQQTKQQVGATQTQAGCQRASPLYRDSPARPAEGLRHGR